MAALIMHNTIVIHIIAIMQSIIIMKLSIKLQYEVNSIKGGFMQGLEYTMQYCNCLHDRGAGPSAME